jgi:hypothetical protein
MALDLKNLKVELVPHVGKQGIRLAGETTEVEVDMGQMFVFCELNGRRLRVGIYCGRANEPNKHLSFTDMPPLPTVVQEAIAKEVSKLTGGISHFTAPAPEEHEVATDDDE